ncbi:hypothetical protein Vadar_004201 [Vaccinium darrowii]|uniref:Uncharacterized protein n=1 Tax=Vaccinium darrowii TaxID=229202 RepID=A0ACB7XXA5_9ERIC|nr:hypothetical protein Vadar_004201 [Vaccinium darrowii]
MVHNKNRNPPPPPTTAANHGRAPPPDNNPNQEQTKTDKQLSSIKSECQLAIAAFRRNPAKAHKLIEAACLKYENCALVHAARSNLHALEACRIGSSDVVLKQKNLIGAAQSARRAVSLSPNSIEFGVFYAEAMYELSRDVQGLDEVVRECERGLSIENPIDPAEESFRTAWLLEKSTAEERILKCRKRLESILQKSRSASLSLKNLAKGNPLDCVMVGVGSVVTGTKNGNSKEIKIGVLEEGSEKPELDNYRMSERKRQAVSNEIVRASVKKGKSRTYWNAMSDERKTGLLELRVGDLREYYSSLCKDGLAERVFSEGIGYAEKNKSWKFWGCYYCDEKFEDMELRMKHIERKHEGEIGCKLKVKPFVFPEINAEWADLLVNGTWKPVDTPRAIKMIEKQLKSQLANLFDEDCSVENCAMDQLSDQEPNESSDQEPNESQHCRGRERRSHDESLFGLGKSVGHFLPEAFRNDQKWPLSDDIDRANILQEIPRQFQVLVRDKFLSVRNLNKVITYTIAELQNFIPASQLQIQGLGKSPLCICFLEVSQLEKILEFLQGVYELSGSDSGKSNDRRR